MRKQYDVECRVTCTIKRRWFADTAEQAKELMNGHLQALGLKHIKHVETRTGVVPNFSDPRKLGAIDA